MPACACSGTFVCVSIVCIYACVLSVSALFAGCACIFFSRVSVMGVDKMKEKQVASSWSFLVSLSHHGNPPPCTPIYLVYSSPPIPPCLPRSFDSPHCILNSLPLFICCTPSSSHHHHHHGTPGTHHDQLQVCCRLSSRPFFLST